MARVPLVSTTDNPKRKGYDLALDDLLFRTAVSPQRQLTISSAEFPSQQINLTQNPEDITTNVGQIFSRSNFSGGQGLDSAHQRNNSEKDITRFYDSKGVDVFHGDDETSYHTHLLYTTTDTTDGKVTYADTNNYLVRTLDSKLWLADDKTIYVSTDGGDTWSSSTTFTYDITGVVAYGNQLFVTAGSGTNKQLKHYSGGTWTTESLGTTLTGYLTGIFFAKGTLFVSGVSSTGTHYLWYADPIQKNFNNQFTTGSSNLLVTAEDLFTDLTDAGAAILVANENGTIYSIKDVSGTPTLQGETKIPFEEIHTIVATEGIVFFGTKEFTRDVGRLYRADLVVADNLYVLANRQLIKEWVVDSIDTTPHAMFVSRDSVYIGVREEDSKSYLWRYYLPTAGLARDLEFSAGGLIYGITQHNGKFVVSVVGQGVYKETSTYVSTGYIILPNADFFTSEDKQWVGVEVEHNDLGNGKKVEIYVTTTFDKIDEPDSASWELIGESVSGTGGVEYQLNRNARYINAKVVLEPNVTFDESPEFRGISIRALPRPELVVVTVPINLSDQVERPRRKAFKVKNLGEVIYQTLKQKEGDSVTLTLYEPSEIIRGVVESVQYPISERSEVGSVTQFCLLRVRGVRAEDAATIVTRLLGVGKLGVAGLG
jgi:hypothetical protein